jgi:hypothetical protein
MWRGAPKCEHGEIMVFFKELRVWDVFRFAPPSDYPGELTKTGPFRFRPVGGTKETIGFFGGDAEVYLVGHIRGPGAVDVRAESVVRFVDEVLG